MINKISTNLCSGCKACEQACNKNAITMQVNSEGFWYPKIDEEKCNNCGLCDKLCHYKNLVESKPLYEAYACINKNDEVRYNSTSGGAFYELAKYVISQNGCCFGCEMNSAVEAVHSYAETLEDCKKYQGSKYVQSDIGKSYSKAKEFLNAGRMVLFTGTPCQINGLKKYLVKDYENLLTMDVVCHGVPSPKVLKKYILELEEKFGARIVDIKFRDKRENWSKSVVVVVVEGGKEYYCSKGESNVYIQLFLKNICLRASCHNCQANGDNRLADISLADFWGVQNSYPDMFDDKGTSLVLVNTQKGKQIFEKISDNMLVKPVDFEIAAKSNPCISSSVAPHKNRDEFFKNLDKYSLDKLRAKYLKVPLYKKVLGKVKRIAKKILGR